MLNAIRRGWLRRPRLTVDWTWGLITILMMGGLGFAVMPSLNPSWQPDYQWLMAAAAAGLFIGFVLLHELAHAFAAQAQGLAVRRVSLARFTAETKLETRPASPRHEVVIASAGPGINLLLAFAVWLFVGNTSSDGLAWTAAALQSHPLAFLARWLVVINVLLGGLSLLPAVPLDGGHMLHALFWHVLRDRRRATRWVVRIGLIVAVLLIVATGVVLLGPYVTSRWLRLIGAVGLLLFGATLLRWAAWRSRLLRLADRLAGVPVARLMNPNVPTIQPTLRLDQLVDDYIVRVDARAFPVTAGRDRFVGLLTVRDLRRIPVPDWSETRVGEAMTPARHLEAIHPRDDAAEAVMKLMDRDVPQLPVVHAGRVVGMLRYRDIRHWLSAQSDFSPI